MTDSIARIKGRAAAQARLDLQGKSATKTGKTRKGKLNCTAGNKQCGSRCIPQAWDCRLEGKGTNSELKSHSYDPLGGVASIERGVKTIAKNPTSVQNLERGRNSIIRGVVKSVPGDNLEAKKKLKRNLQKYGNQIGSVLLVGASVVGAHQSAKRLNKDYARGLGRDIDMAAFGAVDAVLNRTPFIRDRRSNIRGNAVEVSEGLGRAFAFEARKQASEARALGNSGRIGPLSFPPGGTSFLNTGLVPSTQALQRRVRNGEVGYDQWVKESTGLLYGAKVKGQGNRSIYSDDAANRYISRQFGLNTPGALQRVGQVARSQSSRDGDVKKELSRRFSSWGDTMRADMELRRFERDKSGNFTSKAISSYVDTRVIPNMGLSRGGLSASQQNAARRQARNLAVDILSNGNKAKYDGQATTLRRNVVAQYDNYFSEVSDRMGLAGGSKQSTFGDGQVGLARYVMNQQPISGGRVVPVKSRSHANLILRDYFTRKVQNDRGGSFTSSAGTVQRVAQQINGSRELPDAASAYSIVRESGISSLRSPSEAPSTTKRKTVSKPKKPAKTGLAAQRSQSDLARAIMKRKGFEGSYAEALAQARREMKRSDTAEDRNDLKKSSSKGKPCGESHIQRTYTCNVGHNKVKTAVKVAIGTSAVIGTAYLLKKYAFTTKDAAEFAKAKPYRVGKSVKEGLEGLAPLGKGADGAVYLSKDGKTAFKQVHNPKHVMQEVTNHLRAQTAGVKTANIQAYDAEKGIIKMEALTNHKPVHAMNLGAEARHKAAVSLVDNMTKLHSKGMMHGDIRGNNILVDQTGDTRVIDFARSSLKVSENARRSEMSNVLQVLREREWITEATHSKVAGELGRSRRQLHGDKAITHAEAMKRVTRLINRDRNK